MQQIKVEPALGNQLSALEGQAIICDSGGRALGVFSALGEPAQIEDLQLEPPLSIAETEELRKDCTGKPLEEILRQLGVQ